jgi:hypothetical protein
LARGLKLLGETLARGFKPIGKGLTRCFTSLSFYYTARIDLFVEGLQAPLGRASSTASFLLQAFILDPLYDLSFALQAT